MVRRERLLEVFDIDVNTGIIRWVKPTARCVKIGDIAGTLSKEGYWQIRLDNKRYYHHHIIWFIVKGYWPKKLDHEDTNKLNNSITNLREATQSQNQCNRSKPKHNTSGYKGVTWNNIAKKWQAQIKKNNKSKTLGYFENKHDAARTYNEAAIKYHGDFAKLNEIKETQ